MITIFLPEAQFSVLFLFKNVFNLSLFGICCCRFCFEPPHICQAFFRVRFTITCRSLGFQAESMPCCRPFSVRSAGHETNGAHAFPRFATFSQILVVTQYSLAGLSFCILERILFFFFEILPAKIEAGCSKSILKPLAQQVVRSCTSVACHYPPVSSRRERFTGQIIVPHPPGILLSMVPQLFFFFLFVVG